jgi:hypothetical protein
MVLQLLPVSLGHSPDMVGRGTVLPLVDVSPRSLSNLLCFVYGLTNTWMERFVAQPGLIPAGKFSILVLLSCFGSRVWLGWALNLIAFDVGSQPCLLHL